MLLAATHVDKVAKCHKTCQHLSYTNITHNTTPSLIMTVNSNHFAFSPLQLVCSIGGIIGLYLESSLFDILDFSHFCTTIQGQLRSRLSRIQHVMKTAVCIIGVVLALWQFHTFLMNHEISVTISQTDRANRSEQLALTVCRWSPLSLNHVADITGVNISERSLMKMAKEDRQPELLRVLENLPGNWSMSLDEIRKRAAWNLSDVVEAFLVVRRDGMTCYPGLRFEHMSLLSTRPNMNIWGSRWTQVMDKSTTSATVLASTSVSLKAPRVTKTAAYPTSPGDLMCLPVTKTNTRLFLRSSRVRKGLAKTVTS